MKNKFLKRNLGFILPIIFLLALSLINIYSARYVTSIYKEAFIRQGIWILFGVIICILIYNINIKYLLKYSFIFYIFGVVSLVLVLFFAPKINGARSWFRFIGISLQPSELFKFFYMVSLCKLGSSENKNFLTMFIVSIIPIILIFLEPDSGVALMYFIISFVIVFMTTKRKKLIIWAGFFMSLICFSFIYLYFTNQKVFIDLFGTSFFYRMDRLVDFKNNTSYQLSNALIGIGASGITGLGIKSSKIYVPELITDFAFDLTAFNFGYMMLICVSLTYTFLLIKIFSKTNTTNSFYKLFYTSSFCLLLYQVTEHIFMNLGLAPITGITLPFLSYGGSSLVSYFMILSLLLKNSNKKYID